METSVPPDSQGFWDELERRTVQEPLCSPVSILASFLLKQTDTPALILVTGKSGAGKTIWCLELVHQARLAGFLPYGFVSPAVFENGSKIGIDLLEIQHDERRRLAVRRTEKASESGLGIHTAGWQFDEGVLEWANQVLDEMSDAEFLIIDELGPLELLENKGLVRGLEVIDERKYRLACVTVRPLLLATARERWPWAMPLDITERQCS